MSAISPIPLVDLAEQYRRIRPEIDAAIHRTLAKGCFILGPEVEALEKELAAYCGTAHAVGVASGTDALELSLRALGIGPGDEVITTAFSFFATAEAVLVSGATPVFVDIDPATYNLDAAQVSSKISSRTKAVIPVHLYGYPCEMDALQRIAKQHTLRIVEDCAQAIGAQYGSRRVGSFGDAGAFSFFPSKNLGGYGDGGMVVTNDASVAESLRLLRVHGSRKKYHHQVLGRNSRLDELQAAILRVKLRYLDEWNAARRSHAHRYAQMLAEAGLAARLGLPQEQPGCVPVYHLYTIRLPGRERVMQALAEAGIASQIAYPSILPAQPALQKLGFSDLALPHAEAISREVLSLPMYPELRAEDIQRIVTALHRALSAS